MKRKEAPSPGPHAAAKSRGRRLSPLRGDGKLREATYLWSRTRGRSSSTFSQPPSTQM